MNKQSLLSLYGVSFYNDTDNKCIDAREDDLYYYKVFVGRHDIKVERGDCLYYFDKKNDEVSLTRGPFNISSDTFAVLIRGYMPENKRSGLSTKTYLPYLNGCSSKQVFPPERKGDPTLQILDIPPHTSEQAHHIHATVRVVYVLSGKGKSIIGMSKNTVEEDLYPGRIIILEKMCPHHFETGDERLIVMPLHIFSSIEGELNHPMANGTILTAAGVA
ncbi:MAG: cupin domain-containing protein [Methylobacter sp.]